MSPSPPSRKKALHHRHLLLFQQQLRDADGRVFRKPWPAWSWPSQIQTQSAGLGLYFKTLAYFIMVMTLFSLVAVGPFIANYNADNFSTRFSLMETGSPDIIADCPKGFQVGSYILDFSLGNHCADSDFSGAFDCPATCTFNTSKLDPGFEDGLCSNVTVNPNTSCNTRPICRSSDECKVSDERDATVCCTCCDLELNEDELKDVPVWQAWLWCIVGTLIWVVWISYLQKMQAEVAAEINVKNITSADFSIWVSNLPETATGDVLLREYAEHYGEVSAAFQITDVGNVLNISNQVADADKQLAETMALEEQPESLKNSWLSWADFLYKRGVRGWFSGPEAGEKSMQEKVQKLEKKLKHAEEAELKGTGTAIIVFTYSAHKGHMLDDHYRANKFAQTFLSPGLQRLLNILTRGLFTQVPRLQVPDKKGSKTVKHFISVQRAPEASDIWWENAVSGYRSLLWRRVAAMALYIGLIAVSSGIQFIITRLAEQERQDRINEGRVVSGTSLDPTGATILSSFRESAALRMLSVAQGLVVTILNIGVFSIVSVLTGMERHLTTTSHLTSMVGKLSLFYFLNSFAVPVIAQATLEGSRTVWYTRGGLAESGFYIQLTNAFIPDLVGVLDIGRLLKYHVLSRFARTQAYLNANLEPPPFDIPLRLSTAVRTISLGVLYAPVLPISPMLSLLGLLISYLADLFLALHACRKPSHFDVDVLDIVNYILNLLPLVQMLLISQLYFIGEAVVPFALGVAMFGVFFLTPIRQLTRCVRDKNFEPDGAHNVSFDILRSLGLQGTSAQHGAAYGARYKGIMADIGTSSKKNISSDFYFPNIPNRVAALWTKKVHARLSVKKSGPNIELLEGQRTRTGGEIATRVPLLVSKGKVQQAVMAEDAVGDGSDPMYPRPMFELVDPDQPGSPPVATGAGTSGAPGQAAEPEPSAPPRPGGGIGVPSAPAASPYLLYASGSMKVSDLHQPGFYPSPFLGSLHLPPGAHVAMGGTFGDTDNVGTPVATGAPPNYPTIAPPVAPSMAYPGVQPAPKYPDIHGAGAYPDPEPVNGAGSAYPDPVHPPVARPAQQNTAHNYGSGQNGPTV